MNKNDQQTQKVVMEFEHEVRTVVRRGSKSIEFENQIKEISAHFADLIQEEMGKGATPAEAEYLAMNRLGTPQSIGLQILNSPSRVEKGIRIQKISLIALFLSTCQIVGIGSLMSTSTNGGLYFGLCMESIAFHFVGAIIYGYGAILTQKLLWKPLLLATATIFAALVGFYKFEEPRLSTYMATPNTKVILSKSWPIVASYQMTEILLISFLGVALISYLFGRIWILRLSWFRLTRS